MFSLNTIIMTSNLSFSSLSMFVEDKTCCKGPIPVSVSPNSTVLELKVHVQNEFEFPVGVQRWILDKTLADNDNATLSSIGIIKSEQKIFLYLVAPGNLCFLCLLFFINFHLKCLLVCHEDSCFNHNMF